MITLATDGFYWPRCDPRAVPTGGLGSGVMSPPDILPSDAPEACIPGAGSQIVCLEVSAPDVCISDTEVDVEVDSPAGIDLEVEPC